MPQNAVFPSKVKQWWQTVVIEGWKLWLLMMTDDGYLYINGGKRQLVMANGGYWWWQTLVIDGGKQRISSTDSWIWDYVWCMVRFFRGSERWQMFSLASKHGRYLLSGLNTSSGEIAIQKRPKSTQAQWKSGRSDRSGIHFIEQSRSEGVMLGAVADQQVGPLCQPDRLAGQPPARTLSGHTRV